MKRSPLGTLLVSLFDRVNRRIPWHRLPQWLAIPNLVALRIRLREDNLYDCEHPDRGHGTPPDQLDPDLVNFRTADGSYNDLEAPRAGSTMARFGRNVPRDMTHRPDDAELLDPSPRTISRKLMTRDEFQPATILNLLAAVWIQFQTHDWFHHGEVRKGDDLRIALDENDDWFENPMQVPRTPADPSRGADEDGTPETYANAVTHWWDGSQIYGSDEATIRKLRTGTDGKLRVDEGSGLLPVDGTGVVETGFRENWWLGLEMLHTTFALEHNAVCDRLKQEYPDWTDDRLFGTARLVIAALTAKIHTVEWTPALLSSPTLVRAMNTNWWGMASEKVKKRFGRISDSEVISGIPGSPVEQHGVPFSVTEEFVSVYRMHPLLPDELTFLSVESGEEIGTAGMPEVSHEKSAPYFRDGLSMGDAYYSFGRAHPGAITLHNYPEFLRDFTMPNGIRLDLASVDILRDRERGIPRYNEFRRRMHMPPIERFEDLCANPEWAEEIREVYDGDIEKVDLMVGMFAETPPDGFAFSDTAFRVFILMASRRLKSDRFFTTHYTPEVYTQVGLDWVEDNTMSSVLLRHYPELEPALRGLDNAFVPWNPVSRPAVRSVSGTGLAHEVGV